VEKGGLIPLFFLKKRWVEEGVLNKKL